MFVDPLYVHIRQRFETFNIQQILLHPNKPNPTSQLHQTRNIPNTPPQYTTIRCKSATDPVTSMRNDRNPPRSHRQSVLGRLGGRTRPPFGKRRPEVYKNNTQVKQCETSASATAVRGRRRRRPMSTVSAVQCVCFVLVLVACAIVCVC